MGMTLRDPSQADFNQLKKMLVDGTITPQQLQGADVSYTGPPERIDQSSKNMLAQMMQGQDSPQSQGAQPKQVWDQAAADQAFQMKAKQTSQQIYNDNPNNLLNMLKSQTPVGPTPRDPSEPDALDKILPTFLKATNYSPEEQQARLNLARNADREADLALRIGQSQDPMAQAAVNQALAGRGQSPEVSQGGNTVQMDGGPLQSIGQTSAPTAQSKSDEAGKALNQDGVPLNQLVAGGGYQGLKSGQGIIRITQPDGSTEDRYINDSPTQSGQSGQQAFQIPSRSQGPAAPMKVYGYDQGMIDDLGTLKDTPFNQGALNADYSRGMIEIPGMGKGYYSRDGRHSIMTAPDGTKYAALIGYDRAGSQAIADANMQRQKTQGDITHTAAETALVNAKVADYGKPDASSKAQIIEVVDPNNPSQKIKVDANVWVPGTSLGAKGVYGVGESQKLAQGERALQDGTVEQIPGSAAYQKQALSHGKSLGAIETINTRSDGAIAKIDDILSDKNKSGFENNFGGYNALITNKFPGNTQDVYQKIESLKNNMKAAGLDELRATGGIGSMTEREWPIVQGMIASIDPKLGLEAARQTFADIRNRLNKIKDNAADIYQNEWSGTQYSKAAQKRNDKNPNPNFPAGLFSANGTAPSDDTGSALPSNPSGTTAPPLIRSADTSASIRNAQAAINSGIPRNVVIQRLRAAGIMDNP